MKKIIIFFLVLHACAFLAGYSKPISQENVRVTTTVPASTFQKAVSFCKDSVVRVAYGTDQALEYIIKPKNILKISILLTPVAILFAKVHGQHMLDSFFATLLHSFDTALKNNSDSVDAIIQHIGQIYAKYDIQVSNGKVSEFVSTLFSKPFSALSYGAYKIGGYVPKILSDGLFNTAWIACAAKSSYDFAKWGLGL